MAAVSAKSHRTQRSAGSEASTARQNDGRSFHVATLVIVAGCLVVHVISAQPRFAWMWGAHFYAFFPAFFVYAATILVAAGVVVLDARRKTVSRWVERAPKEISRRAMTITVVLSAAAGAALFWIFRICHTYLGDGNVIVAEIDSARLRVLPREPLTNLLQHVVYHATRPWFAVPGRDIRDVAQDAVAVGSVVAGAAFLTVLWFVADELSRLRARPERGESRLLLVALIWLCLAGQGYIQLFFGYVENYSFHAVGVALFFWLCLRSLRGACGLLPPALALCLAIALHLSSVVLAIPFLAVLVAVLAAPERRRDALRDLLAVALIVAVLVVVLASRGYNPFATLFSMAHTAFAERRNQGYMFSGNHYRDFLNEQILIGPLGLFLFLAALVTLYRGRTANRSATAFLALAGGALAVACWMVGDSNLGYARDWDLLSHAGLVFTVSGIGLMIARRTRLITLAACFSMLWLVSMYHTVPWVATNASEARSLARLQTLPLGYGRTEVLVAGWYEREGDGQQARAWLQRSIHAFAGNPNSHFKLGMIEMKERHYALAATHFDNAAYYRPDKLEYHVLAVRASFLADQPGRAVPHLDAMMRAQPGDLTTLLFMGEALLRSGQVEAAGRAFADARAGCEDLVAKQPRLGLARATYGWVLFRLGETDEAVKELSRAIEVAPGLQQAHCYLGCVLRSLGRDAEAREQLLRCRELGADLPVELPDRAAIIASLASP